MVQHTSSGAPDTMPAFQHTYDKNVAGKLKDLTIICQDGRDFYAYAAQETKDPELHELFTCFASIREDAIGELQANINALGETAPVEEHSLAGIVRQNYAKFKKMLSLNENAALVDELEETEDRTLEAFNQALDALPPSDPVRIVVIQQRDIFKGTHARMRALKEQMHQ